MTGANTAGLPMTYSNLPSAVVAFFSAVQTHDINALLAVFADDAVLTDGGEEYQCGEIEGWSGRYMLCDGIRPIDVANRNRKTIVTTIVWDNIGTSASGALQLEWRFTLRGDRISALNVSHKPALELLAPVSTFIYATNTLNLDMLLATFADDALVNDQLRDLWGADAIRKWATHDIIGIRMAMYVVKAVEHYGHVIVTANVDGDYDKRGLPQPLVDTFYFSMFGDKIVQLIILRNQPDI